MKVEELKGYGRSFAQTEPQGWSIIRITIRMVSAIRRELGLRRTIALLWRSEKERRRMLGHDWSRLREQGLNNRRFLNDRIRQTAFIASIVRMLGYEKGAQLIGGIMETMSGEIMQSLIPEAEKFNGMQDPFVAFKEYLKAANAANRQAGIHDVQIVEDANEVFAYNVVYCAYQAVAVEFGDSRLCYPMNCRLDELFFPVLCRGLRSRFLRKGTLAGGAEACDFRFERDP